MHTHTDLCFISKTMASLLQGVQQLQNPSALQPVYGKMPLAMFGESKKTAE